MSKAVFQSGITWTVVEKKWPETREAFFGFDPPSVASLGGRKLDALTNDRRVIRNRRKIEAIIENARAMLELESEHGSFRKYLRSHDGFEATVKDMRKRFRFIGELGAYYFLYVVGETVPEYDDWCSSRNIAAKAHAR